MFYQPSVCPHGGRAVGLLKVGAESIRETRESESESERERARARERVKEVDELE